MKKFIKLLTVAATLFAVGCQKYNDTPLKNRVGELENRITALEELCKQMNTNISSLQTLVNALQEKDYITGVFPITKDDETVGYTITFGKAQPITIYNGKDGKDGNSPTISVKQDSDGVYYWTLNGASGCSTMQATKSKPKDATERTAKTALLRGCALPTDTGKYLTTVNHGQGSARRPARTEQTETRYLRALLRTRITYISL